MKAVITGGAGFIGSNLAAGLLERGWDVKAIDNLSSGSRKLLPEGCEFVEGDLSDQAFCDREIKGDVVFHLSAMSDIRGETFENQHTQSLLVTRNVLEAMRKNGVRRIAFTSTSVVYGRSEHPLTEGSPTSPISYYGAFKLAAESLISVYCYRYGMEGRAFRIANVIGRNMKQGVVFDFFSKLKADGSRLEILGDGSQRKSYIDVKDCIDGIMAGTEQSGEGFQVFNLGSEDWITAREIADIVASEMGARPAHSFTGGEAGWKGDIPRIFMGIGKLKSLGWKPSMGSREAVRSAVRWLIEDSG